MTSTTPSLRLKLKKFNPKQVAASSFTMLASKQTFNCNNPQILRLGDSDTFIVAGDLKPGVSIEQLMKLMKEKKINPEDLLKGFQKQKEGDANMEDLKIEVDNNETKEQVNEDDEDDYEKDIEVLMKEGKVSREQAVKIYEENDKDFVQALIKLKDN